MGRIRTRSCGVDDVAHGIKAGGLPPEEMRSDKRTASEDRPAFGPVRQDDTLIGSEKHHVMVARYRAATDSRVADRSRLPLEARAVAGPLLRRSATATPVSRRFFVPSSHFFR